MHDLNLLRRRLRLPAAEHRGSLALRHVDAGSCNGCEHELTACANPYYDLARYGLAVTASPRHADVLLVTGPITSRMVRALLAAYESMPEPRIVAALGNCALNRDVIADPDTISPHLDDLLPVTVRIEGCPPTPEQIITGLAPLLKPTRRPHHATTGSTQRRP